MNSQDRVSKLLVHITPLRTQLANHEMYRRLGSIDDMRVFMGSHVFAVWDFMSLLKSLQRCLTCVELPWIPLGRASTRRLINEIVLEEESDSINGVVTGHFELYIEAMNQIGADTRPITRLLHELASVPLNEAIACCGAPAGAVAFMRSTFSFIDTGKPHVISAAFTFGREDSIPAMFRMISNAVQLYPESMTLLSTYLIRHLQLDEEDHAPKAIEMLCDLCGDDDVKWDEAASAAYLALEARLRFWTAIASNFTLERPVERNDGVSQFDDILAQPAMA